MTATDPRCDDVTCDDLELMPWTTDGFGQDIEDAMTTRERYEAALGEWTRSVVELQRALSDFMDDGLQTPSGTWILTMSQTKAETLRIARRRAETSKAVLDRIIDDLQMPLGPRTSN